MRDNPTLLDLMLASEASQPAIYRPGPYWSGNQRRAIAAIRRHGITGFRNRPEISKGFADAVPADPTSVWIADSWRDQLKITATRLPFLRDIFASYVRLARNHAQRANNYYAEYFQCRFGAWLTALAERHVLPDMMHGDARQRIEIGDQVYNPLYLDHLMRIDNFSKHVDYSKVRSLLEIGGGFGSNVHLHLTLYPGIRKVFYVDIPPVIYIATEYLRYFFGAAVRDFSTTMDVDKITFSGDDSLEIVCLCPWQIERLMSSVDLFWNASSMSEMPPDIVSNYARHVARLLAPSGAACLLLNKDRADDDTTSRPKDVLSAFPGISFTGFEPAVEHRQHGRYAIGRRLGGSGDDAEKA